MDGHPRLFSASTLCGVCPIFEDCGASLTDLACPETRDDGDPGGAAVSHPLAPETFHEVRQLGGVGFSDIAADAVPLPRLPLYLPQVRNRRSFRGILGERTYAVRARDVVKKDRVIPASELRDHLGLRPSQQLILLLFDADTILESMWERGGLLVWQLKEAEYDLVIAPSFSIWSPRPRTEFMINMRRSILYYRALLDTGIAAIPRLGWQVAADARRWAAWVSANPVVNVVALDWSTYRTAADWNQQLEGLVIFERLTGHRVTYLINGMTTIRRCEAVFRLVPEVRVRITNATTQARIAPRRLRPAGDQTGATFAARRQVRLSSVEAGLAQALSDPVGGVDRSKLRQAA